MEARPLARLRTALGAGELRFDLTASGRPAPLDVLLREEEPLPEGAGARLGCDEAGRCLFLETRGEGLCALHRQLGVQALPMTCRAFPRLSVLEPDRIAISLSHYCPTAARLLLDPPGAAVPVLDPPAFPRDDPWEGLDARSAPAPLRPGVFLDRAARDAWERSGLGLLAAGDDPDRAVALLEGAAERALGWGPEGGALAGWVLRGFEAARGDAAAAVPGWERRLLGAERVRSAAPRRWRAVAEWPGEDAFRRWVAPSWRRFAAPVGRYLAARFFACWGQHLGEGLRTHAAWVRTAHDALVVEAARAAAERQALLDEPLLVEAIRETDRRLLHLADPGALAAALVEAG